MVGKKLEFTSEAKVGERFNRYGMSIFVYKKDDTCAWWWSYDEKKWVKNNIDISGPYSNCKPCRTLKAFKRHVRKHMGHIKDAEIVWSNRYIGYSWSVFV